METADTVNMIDGWNLTAPKPEKLPPPLERKSQIVVFDWAKKLEGKWPVLRLLHSVPNEAKRHPATAALLKAMGLKPGCPDIWLPAARGGFIGWVREMKRKPNGPSDVQTAWLDALSAEGWNTGVAYSADEAIEALQAYVTAPKTMIVPQYAQDVPF